MTYNDYFVIEELQAKLRDADFRERGLHEALRKETAAHEGAVEALREIAGADPVDLALDPTWVTRIAQAALEAFDG